MLTEKALKDFSVWYKEIFCGDKRIDENITPEYYYGAFSAKPFAEQSGIYMRWFVSLLNTTDTETAEKLHECFSNLEWTADDRLLMAKFKHASDIYNKMTRDLSDVVLDDFVIGVYEGGAMILKWSSPTIGFGEYIIKKGEDNEWEGHAEFMDNDHDKRFLEHLLKQLITKLQIK